MVLKGQFRGIFWDNKDPRSLESGPAIVVRDEEEGDNQCPIVHQEREVLAGLVLPRLAQFAYFYRRNPDRSRADTVPI